jgi:hypothetical protein
VTPAEIRDELDFEDLCSISTKVEQQDKPILVVSAVERLTAMDKIRAVEEGRQTQIGGAWEAARQKRLTYSLYCQTDAHHHCHMQTCGCFCHTTEVTHEEARNRNDSQIRQAAKDYFTSKSGKPVGTTQVGNVGWIGRANDSEQVRGVQSDEGAEGQIPRVVHVAGEMLDMALNTLERLKKDGRADSGEARRLQRLLLHAGKSEDESNWKSAVRAVELSTGPCICDAREPDLAQVGGREIIAPARIQTCPFPASREIIIVDDTGVAMKAYIPEKGDPA